MTYSFKKYLYSKDWRLIVIEFVSLLLAILSAILLEAKFFQIFIPYAIPAGAFAVIIVFAVTFSAYVIADNFKARTKESRGFKYYSTAIVLVLIYAAILTALLGMSNYTMSVLKTDKDVKKLETKIANVDDIPIVVSAKKDRDKTISVCEKELTRLQGEIDSLTARGKRLGWTYSPQKREYERLKAEQNKRIDKSKESFLKIRETESARITETSKQVSTAGKTDGGLGKFLASNPAILPMLALVVLFISRFSFPVEQGVSYAVNDVRQIPKSITLSKTTTTIEEHKITIDMIPDNFSEAINMIIAEKHSGNGVGLQALVAQKFNKSEAWVSKCVRREMVKAVKPVN